MKSPITQGENTEFIWIEVTAIENDTIYGTLANDPMDLGPLRLGSRVRTSRSELNDWMYFDAEDQMQGGFTVKVVDAISRERARQSRASDEGEKPSES